MAIHRFDYPTAAVPQASLVFTRGARLVSDTPSLKLNQQVDRTWGGTPRAKSFGDPRRVYPLTAIFAISSESENDFEDVIAFIMTWVKGAVEEFEWTDENSVVRTVRIMNQDDIPFPKFSDGTQSCTFLLEVIP